MVHGQWKRWFSAPISASAFEILDFQTILPKNYIHHVVKGEPIYDFFEAWKRSAAETSAAKVYGLRQWFINSAESLARKGFKINLQKKFLSKGWLVWEALDAFSLSP